LSSNYCDEKKSKPAHGEKTSRKIKNETKKKQELERNNIGESRNKKCVLFFHPNEK